MPCPARLCRTCCPCSSWTSLLELYGLSTRFRPCYRPGLFLARSLGCGCNTWVDSFPREGSGCSLPTGCLCCWMSQRRHIWSLRHLLPLQTKCGSCVSYGQCSANPFFPTYIPTQPTTHLSLPDSSTFRSQSLGLMMVLGEWSPVNIVEHRSIFSYLLDLAVD